MFVDARPISLFFLGNLNENRKWLHWNLHKLMGAVPRAMPTFARSLFDLPMRLGDRRNAFINFTDGFRRGLAPQAYGRLLELSQVALCPKGFQSPETFRHFEATRAGCVVLSEPLPANSLYERAPFLFYRDPQTLFDTLDAIFAGEIDLRSLQSKARQCG